MNTKLFDNFLDCLRKSSKGQILAGFSGGADSSALLLLLLKAKPLLKLNIRAIHFEHGIRGKSSFDDAVWCREFCLKRKIPFQRIALKVPDRQVAGESIEMAARRCRLEEWEALSKKYPGAAIALAHHADDRIENLFLRLIRGANASGLSSMRSSQRLGGLLILRPVLAWRKTELLDFLAGEGVEDCCEDASNSNNGIPRNFLRNKLLPQLVRQFPASSEGIIASLAALEDDALFLEDEASRHFEGLAGKSRTPISFWRKLPPPLRIRALRLWLSSLMGIDFIPNRALMLRFAETLKSQEETACGEKINIPLSADCSLQIQKGYCKLSPANPALLPAQEEWDWKTKEETIWGESYRINARLLKKCPSLSKGSGKSEVFFDAKGFPQRLVLRMQRNGDTMHPFGTEKRVRLKKLFGACKVSAGEKHLYPLLCDPDGNILWIPGVRRSNILPVTNKGEAVVQLTAKILSDKP